MTKLEAIELMKAGVKVTHRYFTSDEWITMQGNFTIITEEGYSCNEAEFWKWRQGEAFEKDWHIYINKEKLKEKYCMGCHTWFYTEVETPPQELMKERVLNYFNKKLKEKEARIDIINRKIRMVENNHCQIAVINLYCNLIYFEEGIHRYDYKTNKIYKHRNDIGNLFRVSNYPTTILYSYSDCIDFIRNNNITYIDEDCLSKLKEFWDKTPNSIIDFG